MQFLCTQQPNLYADDNEPTMTISHRPSRITDGRTDGRTKEDNSFTTPIPR